MNLSRIKRFPPLHIRSDQPWFPPSVPSNGYQRYFLVVKLPGLGVEHGPQLAPRLRISEAISPLTLCTIHDVLQGKLAFVMTVLNIRDLKLDCEGRAPSAATSQVFEADNAPTDTISFDTRYFQARNLGTPYCGYCQCWSSSRFYMKSC